MGNINPNVDFTKPRRVVHGPLHLFEGSFIVEFLEPEDDGSFLLRVTLPANHPLNALEKKHPITPPLHIHLDQTEFFHVQQGRWGVTLGWDRRDTILTPGKTVKVPPMTPHTVWPVACDEDTILYSIGQPRGLPKAVDNNFFNDLFPYLSMLYETKQAADILQLVLMNHETSTVNAMLPGWSVLGSARWRVPWIMEGALAGVARWMGYTKHIPEEKKKQP